MESRATQSRRCKSLFFCTTVNNSTFHPYHRYDVEFVEIPLLEGTRDATNTLLNDPNRNRTFDTRNREMLNKVCLISN